MRSNHPYAVNSVTNVNGGTYSASYDADGNMVTRNGEAIQWTPSNLPSSIAGALGTSTFSYGPDGARYYQTASLNGVTTDTTYVGGLFEVVATASSTEYRHNIVADGQVIAVHTITATGVTSTDYLHYDHLGSVNAITDATGAVIQQMSFDAFGQRRIATNWDYGVSQATLATLKDDTDRGYTGEEQLDNLSLVDLNGRVYDPTVGRFISADPTDGSGPNRYTYVNDNPLEFSDPTGFCTLGCFWQPSKAVNLVGSAVGDIFQGAGHILNEAGNYAPEIAAAVAAYYTFGTADAAGWGFAGSMGAAGATYGGTSAALNGDNGTQIFESAVVDGMEAYELGGAYANVAMQTDDAAAAIWLQNSTPNMGAIAASYAVGEAGFLTLNYAAQREVARYANDHGMSLAEMDVGLLGISFLGNALVGSRFTDNFESTNSPGIGGYFDNAGGILASAPNFVRYPLDFLFNTTDTILAL